MSEIYSIQGGKRLEGTVRVEGAKNSALKLMAATVLAKGETCIQNVPDISDVSIMCCVIEKLGATTRREDKTLWIDTTSLNSYETPYELVAKMRASIAVLGPLVARFGKAKVAMPGGCQIGSRKIDMHIAGLEALGVTFNVDHGFIFAEANDGLTGAQVTLDFPSVGATENLMMAATLANGTTVINNAAREPEISDLANMLIAMGANITGQGSPSIIIEGVDELHPCTYSTIGDRIEAGTFLVAGALTGGPVRVEGFNPEHLRVPIARLRAMGCNVVEGPDYAIISRVGDIKPVGIQTLPYPGFPTDLQPQFTVLAAVAKGNSVVTENVFENRFVFTGELVRMGANISIEAHHALVQGVEELSGTQVRSADLRGGAALVLAGLVAEGETRVSEIRYIHRGYANFEGKLASLGANIKLMEVEDFN